MGQSVTYVVMRYMSVIYLHQAWGAENAVTVEVSILPDHVESARITEQS